MGSSLVPQGTRVWAHHSRAVYSSTTNDNRGRNRKPEMDTPQKMERNTGRGSLVCCIIFGQGANEVMRTTRTLAFIGLRGKTYGFIIAGEAGNDGLFP